MAGLGTNPAMRVVVTLAFFATQLASDDAGVKLLADHLGDSVRLPHNHAQRSVANVSAILIRANAALQFADLPLDQTRIGTNGTSFHAREQRVGRRIDFINRNRLGARVGSENAIDCFHDALSRKEG